MIHGMCRVIWSVFIMPHIAWSEPCITKLIAMLLNTADFMVESRFLTVFVN